MYSLDDFPIFNNFIESQFNTKKIYAADTYRITTEGALKKRIDEYMFLSYDICEYGSENPNAFYQDVIRSMPEIYKSKSKKNNDDDFKRFAYAVFKQVKPKILKNYENACWRSLKIIYDHPKRASVTLAAMCLTQVYGKKMKTKMQIYNNNSATKTTLQMYREAFSLQHLQKT
jgi:hypothetical protein